MDGEWVKERAEALSVTSIEKLERLGRCHYVPSKGTSFPCGSSGFGSPCSVAPVGSNYN